MKLKSALSSGFGLAVLLCAGVATAAEGGQWQILASGWDYDPSGTVTDSRNSGDVTYDVDSDLNMSDGDSSYIRIAYEQRGVSRSNAALFIYDVETRGGCTANNATRECGAEESSGGLFGGGVTTTEVEASAEASAPTIAWWSRFGNDRLMLDVGASLSYVSGSITVRGENDANSDDEFDAVLPALYAGLNAYLHDTLRLHARFNGISAGDNAFYAAEYGVTWQPFQGENFSFGLEVGQREIEVEVDDVDSGDQVDIALEGSYLGAIFSF